MADVTTQAFSPLDHLNLTVGGPSDAGVSLGERRFVGKLNLRVTPAKIPPAINDLLGGPLPAVGQVTFGGQVMTAWLGPDEYLILTEPGAESALAPRPAIRRHAGSTSVRPYIRWHTLARRAQCSGPRRPCTVPQR